MVSNVTYRQEIDFFESTCQVIAFVCYWTSDRSIGFARQVVEHFPYVDILKNRIQPPGTLELWGKKKHGQRYVLGLFAQFSRDDGVLERLEWFKTCLKKITKQLPTLKSIAFPRRNKNPECKCSYLQAIDDWAKSVPRISIEIIEITSPHERYLDTTTAEDTKTAPEEGGEKDALGRRPSEGLPYFEKTNYKKIENEVYGWVSQHTPMDAVPSTQEKCAKLATSLSELLLKDNPGLHRKIKAIVPVEDDLFSILEQESSNSDLN